ncbi:MAG TPA: EAL domain-containing protein [Chroococcidiopsis sp.]
MDTSLLRVLIIEESDTEALRVVDELQRSGFTPVYERVGSLEAMTVALSQRSWEMVIANANLSQCSLDAALKVLQEHGIDIPLVVVPSSTGKDALSPGACLSAPDAPQCPMDTPMLAPSEPVSVSASPSNRASLTPPAIAPLGAALLPISSTEANLLALIENTQDAVWSIDTHYRIVTLNSVFKRQFAAVYQVQLSIGTPVLEGLPPEEYVAWKGYYDRALGGDRFAVELHYDSPDAPTDIEVSFSPILTEGGITGVAIFGRDITDRKRAEKALQQAKDQFQAVLDAVPGCVSWFSSDLHYLGINRYLAATFNVRPEDFEGRPLGFMEASPGFAEFVQAFITGSVKESSVEIAARVGDELRSYLVVAQKYAQEQAAVFVGIDISDRHRIEEALRESQERYALAVQGANDGLWDWNLRSNEIYFSPRWKAMLGCSDSEIGNTPQEWFQRTHPDESKWLQAQIVAHLEGRTPHFEIEHRMLHSDGHYRWMLSRGLVVRDQDQVAYRMAGSQTDITERKRAEEQLLHDALHDGLTGLSNRVLLVDRLGQAIERAKRQSDYQFAVLVLDVDRFKVVNDSLGHKIGDQLLVAIAQRLGECIRAGDTLARLGGDEFTILMDDIKAPSEATRLSEKIHQAMQLPYNLGEQELFATVSIGIAFKDAQFDKPDDLLRNADTAMYRAKALGRSRHEMFDSAMHTRAVALLQLETDLRRAIAISCVDDPSQEFQMYYQPVVCLGSGKIAGFEALVRWRHPERGMVSPAEFIPVAEETGLIIPLGEWILKEACCQLRKWQSQFPHLSPLSMGINLSTRQFSQTNLVEQVKAILDLSKLAANDIEFNLKLEITESAIMENVDAATAVLKELKALGVQLLIDDFGTGYSSLSYLHRFPIDTVKIDQSFVSRMGSDNDSEEIVRAIVTLSHNLGMNVIAEGVETAEHMRLLTTIGAEYGQGYFFSRPLGCEATEDLLNADPCWLNA